MKRLTSTVLILSFCLYVNPFAVYGLATSNGVAAVQQTPGVFTVSANGESLQISVQQESSQSHTVVVNGVLAVTYAMQMVGGEPKPTFMTVRYGGQTYSGPIDSRAWTVDFSSGSVRLDRGTERAISLMRSAMSAMASPTYYSMVEAASDEIQTLGWVGCTASIIGWISATWAMVVGCVAVLPCLGLIVLYQISVAGVVCSCAGDC